MNCLLLRTLIERKFVTTSTQIDALYSGVDIAGNELVTSKGTFSVASATYFKSGDVALLGKNIADGRKKAVRAGDILSIDGMEPIRFAATCGLDRNGEKIIEGKRRGRKPKVRTEVLEDFSSSIDDDDEDGDED